MKTLPLTIGCYTDSPSQSQGLYQVQFDLTNGNLTELEIVAPCRNPSFVISADDGCYFITEVEQQSSPQLHFVSASMGHTNEVTQSVAISGDHPCHIAVDHQHQFMITSQYSSGSFDVFALNSDGSIEKRLTTISATGSGPNLERQTGPHAHQCQFLKSEAQFVTVDLGSDSISFYTYDSTKSVFQDKPMQIVKAPAGSGPRHLVFNKNETAAYVVCELSETILVLEKNEGVWGITQEVDALPNEEKGEATAAIKLSPDGQFLYVSCRHQSKISCFGISQASSMIKYHSCTSTEGDFPRDFMITPDGKWAVVANQHSNNLTTFQRDIGTGTLTFTGVSVEVGSPVCVTY